MTATFGSPHHHHRLTDSTNARARELAEAGAPSGTVVTADEQTAGRGRQGRGWFATAGGALLYSSVLRPLGDRPLLPIAIPLAVAEAVEAIAPLDCKVKWPNDIWVEERKLSGMLIEGRPETGGGGWAVIGIGLNVTVADHEFPEELRGRARSIGNGVRVDQALGAVNERLPEWIDAPADKILEAFSERDVLRGREVSWDGGSGIAAGIDAAGHLLVSVGSGSRVALGAGDVHLAFG